MQWDVHAARHRQANDRHLQSQWRRLTFYRDVMEPTYESPVVKIDKSLTRDVARCIACE
jgi:hypothetical protein